jgi:hypothetical protein
MKAAQQEISRLVGRYIAISDGRDHFKSFDMKGWSFYCIQGLIARLLGIKRFCNKSGDYGPKVIEREDTVHE